MRRVSQTKTVAVDAGGVMLEGSGGNCFPACIASVFELPIREAPGDDGNVQQVFDWLALNYPGIGLVSRSWPTWQPREPYYRAGLWIATVLSPRFRERECHNCTTDRRRKSRPERGFFRREECPACEGTGHPPGLHAVVMENVHRVWDPHPEVDWDAPVRIVGEDYFTVTDPSRLPVRALPRRR